MKKERKQDLSSPEEEALEKRVHDMLDITAEDEVVIDTMPASEPKAAKSISITHDDEVLPDKTPSGDDNPKPEAAVTEVPAAASTAPLVQKATKKKVAVTHVEDKQVDSDTSSEGSIPDAIEPGKVTGPPEVAELPTKSVKLAPVAPTSQLINATFAKPTLKPEQSEPLPPLIEPVTVGDLIDKDSVSPLTAQIESSETDRAVSAIIAEESDQLLDAQQPSTVAKTAPKAKKSSPSLFKLLVTSSGFRWTLFLIVVAALVGVGVYPKSRYYALNQAGVRSAASVTIIDQSTLRPLKNAKASIAGVTVTSDENGKVQFSELPLGPTKLVIEKRAFATHTQSVTVGWGSNPLADVNLKPQGTQYSFQIKDALSGKAVTEGEASVGELVATADTNGLIKLTLDDFKSDSVEVTVKAAGYRDQKITISLDTEAPTEVLMSPSRQISFISKRTGKYDLYVVDADGKNETLVLKGTGNESADIALLQHPTDDIAMIISSREGTYTSDGRLLNNLTFVNLKDKTTKTIASSTQIRAIDWIGSRLVYVSLNDDADADDPARYKLMSFDFKSGDNRQLASTNYFNSVVSAGGKIYYAPASAYQNGINVGVFAVFADGSGKRPILDQESWNLIRTAHDELTIAVQQEWYSYKPGDDKAQKRSGQPSDTAPRVYTDSQNGKNSVWVDSRDGKGVIIVYDIAKKSEIVLLSQNGLTGPVRWLNNSTLIFRSATGQETADYVISIDGGAARKVSDVTNTAGIDRWTY